MDFVCTCMYNIRLNFDLCTGTADYVCPQSLDGAKYNIKFRGEPVEPVNQFNYLGLARPISYWSVNTEKLVSKVNKRIGLLCNLNSAKD